VRHSTAVSAIWGSALRPRPRKNWDPPCTGGEQEEVEEDDLDEGRDLDVELPDDHARQEGADDVAEAERPDPDPSSAKPSARVRKIASSGSPGAP